MGKKGIFRGYTCLQHDHVEARTGTVAVFLRNGKIAIIENTMYNSLQGHFSISTYEIGKDKFILGAVYGPSNAADNSSFLTFTNFFEKIEISMNRQNTSNLLLAGDWNVRLNQNNAKPRTVKLIKDFIFEHNINDPGLEGGGQPTWRRPQRGRVKSRLDYILQKT